MDISAVLFLVFVVAFVAVMLFMRNKNKKEQDAKVAALAPGVRVTVANGLTGVVTEVGTDTFKADFSPDQTGSIIEMTKASVIKSGN